METVLAYPRGNIYQIINRETNLALRIETDNPKDYDGAKIIGTQPNPHDLGQLWMIEKVGFGEDQFEIVNCQSNLVWDEEWDQIRLKFGKQNSDQLFKVEKLQGAFVSFKTSAKGNRAVALEGLLRRKDADLNAINQLFQITPVSNSNGLNQTCIIVNAAAGKAIDVPEATWKHGVRLVTWEKNKRFNQRWRWEQIGNGQFLLVSVLNGQCIDIAEEKKDAKSKVVQWDKTGGSNQRWRPVQVGQTEWKIESCHAPGQFLAIKNNKYDNGGELEINNEGNTLVWRIEGYVPK